MKLKWFSKLVLRSNFLAYSFLFPLDSIIVLLFGILDLPSKHSMDSKAELETDYKSLESSQKNSIMWDEVFSSSIKEKIRKAHYTNFNYLIHIFSFLDYMDIWVCLVYCLVKKNNRDKALCFRSLHKFVYRQILLN